jgi:arginine/lysine/ornithine decarboxylase
LPYDIDVTEIYGFDNLQDPQGVLKETAELAAKLYGSNRAFLLVNGSTAGILAAVGAHAGRGDKILMARNCHLSVYNAVALFGLKPVYLMPETDEATGVACSVDPALVASALESDPDIKLVVVTSPTYEGVISDIASIAGITHKRCVPLLVDSAHGAYLGFSEMFPENAVKHGADVVVMSLHKTLPALTQCALLHVCGKRADSAGIARLLSVFQTTSPSYVLMASIDRCLRLLDAGKEKLFCEYERNLDSFNREAEALENLSILCKGGDAPHPGFFAFDPGKIVITTQKTAISGFTLADILRTEHKIELEMACARYAVAMTSVCDTSEGFIRLADALIAIDSSAKRGETHNIGFRMPDLLLPEQAALPGDALKRSGGYVPLEESIGSMSLEYVWAYPPGIPVVAPGEIVDAETAGYISRMVSAGVQLKSTKGKLPLLYVE